jgi:hypothetical protein
MPVAWDLHYDRRVSDDFLAHFMVGGVAHALVEYARFAPYPLDLQMRHNPKTGAEHASLYVGLSSVLNVVRKRDELRLTAHKTFTGPDFGFQAHWSSWLPLQGLKDAWREVENYLEKVIPDAAAHHASREGAVQAAASVFTHHDRIMIDREMALHFRDDPTKKRIMQEVGAPFVRAVKGVPAVPGAAPASFGGECDLLALDTRGRLLAVEVKPRNTGTIVWSGAQATVYARLIKKWVEAPPQGTDRPVTILRGMLEQRHRLGLARSSRPNVPEKLEVVPVVAVQRGAKQAYLERLQLVQNALLEAECGDASLEVYEVSMAGRMDRLF